MRRANIAIRVNTGRLARGFAWVVTSPLRYLIILAWIAGAVAAYRYLPGVGLASGGNLGLLAPTNSVALHVEKDSLRLFAFPVLSRTAIVQRDPRGLPAAAQQRVIERALEIDRYTRAHRACQSHCGIAGALPILNTLRLFPSSRERSTTAITYLFFWPSAGLFSRQRLAEQFDSTHQPAR